MLKSNTIRFTSDNFGQAVPFVDEPIDEQPVDPDAPDTPTQPVFVKQALLISKTPLDCSRVSAVDNFIITGSAPSDCRRRLVFLIDDTYYKFNSSGALVIWNYELTADNVLAYGNKPATLTALQNITALVGKKIYPIIALSAPYDAEEMPSIKLALATHTANDQLTNTFDSPIYELDDEAQTIINIDARNTLTGSAELDITVRLRNDGTWSSYMSFEDAVDETADAVQFKIKATVTTTDGSDSAQVDSILVTHTSGQTVVTGNNANLFSKVQSYEADLQTAFVVVRHAPLVDAAIEAYVNFMTAPSHRELKQIGTGTGSRQEISLGDSNIVASSIKIYQDGEQLYDFDFSGELSTVILTAKNNSVLTASYDYDYGQEVWRKMIADDALPYNDDDGTYSTRFTYSLSNEDSIGMKMGNIRIRLRRLSGSSSGKLANATGKTQLFKLNHRPKPSTITFTENVTWSYDEQSDILSCVASKGKSIFINYDYQGLAPQVLSFAAGFSVS